MYPTINLPLHYTLLWPLAVPAEAKQNRRLWHKWAKQKQRLLSNLKQQWFKALLHSTSFLSTWLAILLRHKLHDSLPSITCSEMKLSRNLFLAITIARSRPTLSNWQWRLLTPQSFAERWRHVTWVTWDDIQRIFYTCKILQLIEKLATCWLGKNCTENRPLLHTTRHQFCAQHYSVNYFCSVQIQTSTMFRAKTHGCYSSHEAVLIKLTCVNGLWTVCTRGCLTTPTAVPEGAMDVIDSCLPEVSDSVSGLPGNGKAERYRQMY